MFIFITEQELCVRELMCRIMSCDCSLFFLKNKSTYFALYLHIFIFTTDQKLFVLCAMTILCVGKIYLNSFIIS
jgi:hypothetical protein